jgi:hypothetical protein
MMYRLSADEFRFEGALGEQKGKRNAGHFAPLIAKSKLPGCLIAKPP